MDKKSVIKAMKERNQETVRDEEGNIFKLLDDELIPLPKNYFNTWEYTNSVRQKLSLESANYPVLDSLESMWKGIKVHYDDWVDFEGGNDLSRTPFQGLIYYIEMGVYPPPELLLNVVSLYDDYILSGGSLTLEEAFFGETIKGVGNHAARKERNSLLSHLRFLIATTNDKTQLQLAEEVVDKFQSKIEPESLLRHFRRKYKVVKR